MITLDRKNLILFVQGGAGDVMAHTPMIRSCRKKYPNDQIIVISTYKDLLKHNPNIDVLLSGDDMGDFYNDYILNKEVRFFKKHFVYDGFLDTPRRNSESLPEFICKMYDVPYDGEKLDYFPTEYDGKVAKTFLGQYDKPVILLHLTGSIPSEGGMFNKTHGHKDLNPKIVAPLVEKFSDKFYFVQIGLEGEPVVPGAIDALGMKFREAVALIPGCFSFIFIESVYTHCSNALGKKGIVVFQNTDPEFFGYENNYNVHWSGGCKDWPCNRPLGATLDVMPGYKNPKTRERPLWVCENQVCAQMPTEELQKVFVECTTALGGKAGKGANTLQDARAAIPTMKLVPNE